jgi:hypothetical protein
MSLTALLVATLLCGTAAAEPEATPDASVSFTRTFDGRSARLLQGLELSGTWKPSEAAPLRMTDDLRFQLAGAPAALDAGGGMDSELRQILALLLGFFPGFGIGHLIAHDRDGFILFLVIDVVLYVVGGIFGFWVIHHGIFWGLGGLVWLVVHIIQALDAYGEAGGPRIVQQLRERAVELSSADGGRTQPIVTTRFLRFDF